MRQKPNVPTEEEPPEFRVERRRRADRRARPTRPWDGLRGWRRRSASRRTADQEIYVDVFSARDVAVLLGIFVLNVFDALFTLVYLSQGGGEANPVMDALLRISDAAFLVQKCLVVGLWLLFLTVHKNLRIARLGLRALLVLYGCVLLLHLVLQTGIH